MKGLNSLLVVVTIFIVNVAAFPKPIAGLLNKKPYSSIKQTTQKRQSTFDPASQLVSTTGAHAWVAPNFAAGDQRGPCPGLNALANHGYLPHNGVTDITTQINAVENGGDKNLPLYLMIKQANFIAAYGMSFNFSAFLALYGTAFDGNALSLDPGYSIGGPTAFESILGGTGLVGTPSGLTGSHNNYEADTSSTRGDLYVL